jgi:hypothetical protein
MKELLFFESIVIDSKEVSKRATTEVLERATPFRI